MHVARCLSCGAPLSETSIIALAPVCGHCRAVHTNVSGTLGLTAVFGVNDPSITRSRIQADLNVLQEYQRRYRDMIEACKQQLVWEVRRYATLPQSPRLLKVLEVPSLSESIIAGIGNGLSALSVLLLALMILWYWNVPHMRWQLWNDEWHITDTRTVEFAVRFFAVPVALISAGFWYFGLRPRFRAIALNGTAPAEDDRRLRSHANAIKAALAAAKSVKAAEDHRLRSQIRELESLLSTVSSKASDVAKLLTTAFGSSKKT